VKTACRLGLDVFIVRKDTLYKLDLLEVFTVYWFILKFKISMKAACHINKYHAYLDEIQIG